MKTQNINAVILGASGAIGAELIELLEDDTRFQKIIIITRRKLKVTSTKIEQCIVDFENIEEYAHQIQGDVLFSTFGTTLKSAGSKQNQYNIDYIYQFNIAKIAKLNGIQNYVLISSSGVNHKSRSFYLKMKEELDNAIRNLGFAKLSIIKPSVLIREKGDSRKGEQMAVKIGELLNRIGVMRAYRPIHSKDVAKAMIFCALNRDYYSEIKLNQVMKASKLYHQ